MARRNDPPPIEPREFRSLEEIDSAVTKLSRRIKELEGLDVKASHLSQTGAVEVAQSNIREAILQVFGPNSPEFREHQHIDIWSGPLHFGMSDLK